MANYRREGGYQGARQPDPTFNGVFNDHWISDRIQKEAIEYAEQLGKFLADRHSNFTTTQFRNFYGELKRIQMNDIEKEQNQTSFFLLKPKIAYAAKRSNSRGAMEFRKQIEKAMDAVQLDKQDYKRRFNNFCDLVEAILAYHKANGGN